MTRLTINVWDEDTSLRMEGTLDNPAALDGPVTPAIILGHYLSANAEQVVRQAGAWFAQGEASQP